MSLYCQCQHNALLLLLVLTQNKIVLLEESCTPLGNVVNGRECDLQLSEHGKVRDFVERNEVGEPRCWKNLMVLCVAKFEMVLPKLSATWRKTRFGGSNWLPGQCFMASTNFRFSPEERRESKRARLTFSSLRYYHKCAWNFREASRQIFFKAACLFARSACRSRRSL